METYDEFFEEFKKIEYERIPFVFRLNKTVIRIMTAICVALVLADIYLILKIPTVTENVLVGIDGTFQQVPDLSIQSNPYFAGMFVVSGIFILIMLWFLAAHGFEKKAFSEASRKANQVANYQRERENNAWQTFKMKNNQY